jgi:hypothetical protein
MSAEANTQDPPGPHTPPALDRLLSILDAARRAPVERLLCELYGSESVTGLLVFGSLSSGRFDPESDVDVIAVTRSGAMGAAHEIIGRCFPDGAWVFRGETGRHEWFGHLTTLWCAEPFLFGIDIGVVEEDQLPRVPVAPGSAVVKDTDERLVRRMAATSLDWAARRRRDRHEEPFRVFSLLVKIRKALRRGHLWNAIDYVTHLRRIHIEQLRDEAGRPDDTSRPERFLEDVLPPSSRNALRSTLPTYDAESVRGAAIALAKEIATRRASTWSREARTGVDVALRALAADGAGSHGGG